MGNWFDDAITKGKQFAEDAIKKVDDIISAAPGAMGDTVKALAQNAKLQSLLSFKVFDTLIDSTIGKIKKAFNWTAGSLTPNEFVALIDKIRSEKLINEATASYLKSAFKNRPWAGQVVAVFFNLISALGELTAQISAQRAVAQQEVNADMRPVLPDAASIMNAVFMDNSTMKRVKEVFAKSGIQDQDIALMFKAAYATLNEGTIRDLFFRGVYDETAVYKRLRENHYTDTRIKEMMQTWTLIPPVQDLIVMAVREVFSPDQRRDLGLDEAFPAAFKEWAEKQGMKSPWPENYWAAHWQLPSAQMGFEMLHRGVIDEKTLRALIKALDYSPRWHDSLMAISYNVMTRVDVRRMFQLGIINADQVEKEYRNMGYTGENAKWLRQWTEIEYNQDIKSYTKNAIIKSYLEGFLTEAEASSYLIRIGFTQGRIDEILDMARYERGVAKRSARVAALKRLFISGQYNADEVQADLRQFNIDDRVIAENIDTWKLEQKAGLKLPRAIDLNDWLAQGVISDDDYKREMRRIGYSDYYVGLYYNAAKAKAIKGLSGG